MVANPFVPISLVGRQAELNQVSQILAADGDLLISGVPGSGRRTLIRFAAQAVDARMVEIDCLRATDSQRFLRLLADALLLTFETAAELALIHRWSAQQPIILEEAPNTRPRLVWPGSTEDWTLLQSLLALPQMMAEGLGCRVVIVFQNFPHIRSWDRTKKWERYLCQEIQRQSRVSYVLVATVAESWAQHSDIQVMCLGPLKREDLQAWIVETMGQQGLRFEAQAIQLFLDYVQGNFGDAIALLRRIWINYQALENCGLEVESWQTKPIFSTSEASLAQAKNSALKAKVLMIQAHQVHRSTLALVEDLSLTFESLLLLLPASQVRVLESLALDPTDSPHSREYIQKHHLSRGGGLQGALASLQQKGLVYGPEHNYQLTMPLLAFWLQYRLA